MAVRRRRSLVRRLTGSFKLLSLVFLAVLSALLAARIYQTQKGLPLAPWHTYAPDELDRSQLASATWSEYIAKENDLFTKTRDHLTRELKPKHKNAANRYYEGSRINPANFKTDWNRSFILQPAGEVRGVGVFLHGLTDTPYSVRHLANHYRASGFIAVAIRLPGHGTTPAGLTTARWEDWVEAAHLAVREARKLAPSDAPLHLVGYSNGAALALIYALDALENNTISAPQKLVLVSPMIGVTAFARFAGIAGLPAVLPAFAKAAWLNIVPEFNPFKYNSFPVNAARQSHLLTQTLQERVRRLRGDGRLNDLAPILTFQSVLDSTVSTRAIVTSLYDHLPANGSELVLFDINRSAKFGPLVRPSAAVAIAGTISPGPHKFTTRLVTNRTDDVLGMMERVTYPNTSDAIEVDLDYFYPKEVFSLSHIALPFPMSDSLYGLHPRDVEDYGINLGAIAARGERRLLVTSLDSLLRMSSNPFFAYQLERINAFAKLAQ